MSSLSGKRAVVTGAASGFGAGIARHFINQGASVGVLDINATGAAETASALGERAMTLAADITDDAAVEQAVAHFCGAHGGIDILVNNAGVGHLPGALEDISEADFDKIVAVNMKSLFLLSRHVVPPMKAQGSGCILNIASTAGVSPRPGLTWYNASKGWLITATRSMAAELAEHHIRVNAINPVAGETPLLSTFMGGDSPELREKFISSIPLGRLSTPDDIGAAAAFLCSDAAGLITGVALEVDGGRCI